MSVLYLGACFARALQAFQNLILPQRTLYWKSTTKKKLLEADAATNTFSKYQEKGPFYLCQIRILRHFFSVLPVQSDKFSGCLFPLSLHLANRRPGNVVPKWSAVFFYPHRGHLRFCDGFFLFQYLDWNLEKSVKLVRGKKKVKAGSVKVTQNNILPGLFLLLQSPEKGNDLFCPGISSSSSSSSKSVRYLSRASEIVKTKKAKRFARSAFFTGTQLRPVAKRKKGQKKGQEANVRESKNHLELPESSSLSGVVWCSRQPSSALLVSGLSPSPLLRTFAPVFFPQITINSVGDKERNDQISLLLFSSPLREKIRNWLDLFLFYLGYSHP